MKVLLLEGEQGAADHVVRQLTGSGHEVTRCHDRDADSFPCEGMIDGHSCPLDGEGVDVALVVRGELSPSLTAREDGVRCALRRHVPLVLAGVTDGSPYVGWATATREGVDEIVDVVEDAAAAALKRHGEAAQRAIVELLEQEGIALEAVTVEVHRRRAQLRAAVHHTVPIEQRVADALAVRVQAALRGLDAYATKIDVTVDEYAPA